VHSQKEKRGSPARRREQTAGTARGKKSGKAAAIEILRKSGKAMPVKEVVAAAMRGTPNPASVSSVVTTCSV
jgi:hypothetical protein